MDGSFFIPWLLLLTMALHLALGIFVLSKAPGVLLNRLVFGLTLNASLWSFAVFMITIKTDYQGLLLWIKIAHAVAAFAPWFLLALVFTFLNESEQPLYKNKTITILFFFSLFLAVLCLTPAMIEGVAFPLENKDHHSGPLFFLYPIFFSGAIGYTLFKLFRQLRIVRGLLRYQIRFFIGGIVVSFITGSLASLFLPLMGIVHADSRTLGPVFSIVLVISITYAIIKYRLMDIRLALGKILEYASSIIIMVALFFGLSIITDQYTGIYFDSSQFFFMFFLIILATLIFPFLKERIRLLINRYLHRGLYDYHDTLLEVNKAMVSILRIKKLLNFIVEKVSDTMYIERALFYLKERDGSFVAAAQKTRQPFISETVNSILSPDSPLLSYLHEKSEVLLITDLRALQLETKELIAKEMKKMNAAVAIPVVIKGQLEGIFFLGFKISGEPYSRDDVNLLSALSYQLAVSLYNSQLYNEVEKTKQYLENILENMGNGLIAVDTEGQVIMFNGEAEKLTGRSAPQVISKKASEVLPPKLEQLLQQSLCQGEGKVGLDLELISGDKRYFLVCNTVLVELPETGGRGVILVLSDVTHYKELEREKNQVQKLASLGNLAAGMAHEIKNPLVAIKTFAELLPERYNDNEFRNDFSRIVSQEIARINKLVMQLLNLSKDPGGSFHKVDLIDLMDEILILMSPQLASQKIQLFKSYQQDLHPVYADRDQLKQAFFNICLNAVQAMIRGGSLKVKISRESNAKIRVSVQDTGPGISSQEMERIFDPFFTTKFDGVGIGLSISKKIITEHGGTVHLSSSSQGTTFEIYLPFAGKGTLHAQADANLTEKEL